MRKNLCARTGKVGPGIQLLRCEPKRHIDVRSFQFGITLPPIAPHTVQTMRGPNDGTSASSGNALTSMTAS